MPGGIIRWLDMNYGAGRAQPPSHYLGARDDFVLRWGSPKGGPSSIEYPRRGLTKGDATSGSFFIKFGKPRFIVKEIARRRKSKPDRSRSRYTLTCYGTALKSASEPRKFVMRGKATLRRELVNQAR